MIKLILFLKKIHFFLLFIILEALAIHYYANSTSYTKVKLVTASNYVVGGLYAQLSGVHSFFNLRRENRRLVEELAQLHNELDALRPDTTRSVSVPLSARDSALLLDPAGGRRYEYYEARVVNNTFTRQENYITLNKGALDGMQPNMAVISGDGIVGYILSCSDHYSVCMSVLNREFNTSGRIKGEDYFGSIYWDGVSYEYVTLTEIPKYAPIEKGDTILTTDYSSIFPPDVMIGTVESFELQNATYYEVKVKLHTNMARVNYVLAVKYLDAEEREALEESVRYSEGE